MNHIELIKTAELNNVELIVKLAIASMIAMQIFQWDDIYPNRQVLEDDLKNGWMYGYYSDSELCGIITLNNRQSPEYSDIVWKYKDENPLVIHRMCVAPNHQVKGIAKTLIAFAEDFALKNHHKTIRLDAFVNNPIATGIYRKLGYIERGIVKFRKGDFYCFEKMPE